MRAVGLSSARKSSTFRSPFAKPAPAPVASTPSKRKIGEDYIPDSADEDEDDEDEEMLQGAKHARVDSSASSGLVASRNVAALAQTQPAQHNTSPPAASYWSVQWRKPQAKKHKTWDGDGVLVIKGKQCELFNEDEISIGKAAYTAGSCYEGLELRIGGKDVCVDSQIPAEKYLKGRCFNRGAAGHEPVPSATFYGRPNPKPTAFKLPAPAPDTAAALKYNSVPANSFYGSGAASSSSASASHSRERSATGPKIKEEPKPAKSPHTTIRMGLSDAAMMKRMNNVEPKYQPTPEGVVMTRPSDAHSSKWNPKKLAVVDVVVDPDLAKLLRPHQKEGIKFMYECVMGMRAHGGNGCILADEMGLGKTLQTITLILTLLQQNPYGGPSVGGVVGKVLVVTPVSLVKNWKKEFNKWLGKHRVGVFVADGDKAKVRSFASSRANQVMLIGYEKLRTVIDIVAKCQPPIGLVVCDEGHRLKSKDSKTTKALDMLSTRRRIILSGTPVQNDLGEFWAMCDFANPGVLDTYSRFSKIYEKPILKSRLPKCKKEDFVKGQARGDELGDITKPFILRRTADLLDDYLPPKHEYVCFVAPSALQLSIFGKLLTHKVLQSYIRGPSAQCLGMINYLKKICNDPSLLTKAAEAQNLNPEAEEALRSAKSMLPLGSSSMSDPSASGKMLLLKQMLDLLERNTDEKIVLVSNYTSTLDSLDKLCSRYKWPTLRLDGSTPQKDRQDLVDRFNRSSQKDAFVFLLSAKAGGVGLNLIGASRLVLFDSDWNPSTDLQAMARIHRDGQKRHVYIYRLLTTGTIDEKIYQRQITKLGLSDQLMGSTSGKGGASGKKADSDSFSTEELRDLFTVHSRTDGCQTHDLLGCDCVAMRCNQGRLESASSSERLADREEDDDEEDEVPKFVNASKFDDRPTAKQVQKAAEEKRKKLAALEKWHHYDAGEESCTSHIEDDVLRALIQFGPISSEPAADNQDDDTTDDGEGMHAHAVARKYDLQQLASKGRGGRLTFVFEMNQQAKMKQELAAVAESEAEHSTATSASASLAPSPAADKEDGVDDDEAFHMDFDTIPDSQPGSPARSMASEEV